MAFLTVGKERPKTRRLYIMDITLPSGMKTVKIGVASGASSKERMLQLVSSIYDKFRTTPMIKIKRDREVPADKVFKYETMLHHYFEDYRYETKHKFDGVTENFCIPLDDAVQAYEAVLDEQVPDHKYIMPEPSTEDQLPF